jgi:hypothetical protein
MIKKRFAKIIYIRSKINTFVYNLPYGMQMSEYNVPLNI